MIFDFTAERVSVTAADSFHKEMEENFNVN